MSISTVTTSPQPQDHIPEEGGQLWLRLLALVANLLLLCVFAMVGFALMMESQSSYLQSILLSRFAAKLSFAVEPGPNPDLRFPREGPYDERLGYAQLGGFLHSLSGQGFVVERQAKMSPELDRFIEKGGYAVYREKPGAGLQLLDRTGMPIYQATYPEQVYDDSANVPRLVADTLMFIEDKNLLDPRYPNRNPAIDWQRFALAAVGQVGAKISPRLKQGGASTLATQIEKFRHSPEGRTGEAEEKLRQMATGTVRSYLDGRDTMAARRRILVTYLNSTPLSSRPGYGEVIGVADGLKAWYGTDFADVNRALIDPVSTGSGMVRKATAYRQVLSLMLAERRPTYYLLQDRKALAALTDHYLNLLYRSGVIDVGLRDAALAVDLPFRTEPPASPRISFVGRKAADSIRQELVSSLHVANFYALDRLDLTGTTSLDGAVQSRVSSILGGLGQRESAQAMGLVGRDLLGAADPAKVTYSVVLYERGPDRNFVRVHADSLNEPFDINSGAKLILGSTAKLRTLVTYLDVMSELHERWGKLSPAALARQGATARDPMSRWAAEYLSRATDRSLAAMLEAAMLRQYSGNPGERFFTGGGSHTFHNFERKEDFQSYTVEEAFKHSVNLSFVRIMRDISHYYMYLESDEPKDQEVSRAAYLARFADEEGSHFLNRFYDDYRGKTPDEALNLIAERTRPIPRRLAVVFRSVRPDADLGQFAAFMTAHLPGVELDEDDLEGLYQGYSVERYSLNDRAYLAGIHPLEMWLANYLQASSGANRTEVLKASAAARQEAYAWLFKTRNAHKQEVRIRILREEDSFDRVWQNWRKQGYPFGHLVPSYATAIGSSGDRPEALARLMGIILNDGMALPTVDVERMRFAAGTPYETELALHPEPARRVIAPEAAAIARRALSGVVAEGTGNRVRGVFVGQDGAPLAIGGKTGTGDNRFESFGAGGGRTGSRVVDRTATFVFFIGDRLYGTVTAYVPGEAAKNYHFTSALAVATLKALAPQVMELQNTALKSTSAQ